MKRIPTRQPSSPIKDESGQLQIRVGELEQALQEKDSIIHSLQSQISSKDSQISKLNVSSSNLASLQSSNNSLQNQLLQEQKNSKLLQDKVATVEGQLSQKSAKVIDQEQQIKDLQLRLAKIKSSEKKDVNVVEDAYLKEFLTEKISAELQQEVKLKNSLLDMCMQQIAELKKDKIDLQSDKKYLQQQNIQLSSVVQQKTGEVNPFDSLITEKTEYLLVGDKSNDIGLSGDFSVIDNPEEDGHV